MKSMRIMSNEQLLADYVETFNEHDIEGLSEFLADDFVFHAEPNPLNAEQFLSVLQIVQDAFPDNTMRLQLASFDDDEAVLLYNNSGTHTADLDLTMLGGPVVSATGKTFELPEGIFDYTLGEGGITAVRPRPNPGGGFQGLLTQLGLN